MSLILEALKRSENERLSKSNKSGQLVTSSFGDADRSEKRSWIPQFLAIALAVNAVLLGGLYLSSKNNTDDSETTASIEADSIVVATQEQQTQNIRPNEQPTPAAAEKNVSKRVVKAATPLAEELVQSAPVSNSSTPTGSWDEASVEKNAAPEIPADFAMIETEEAVPQAVNSGPVNLREVSDDNLSQQLENYEINTHIYNEQDPARSFVLLNMEKYRVGDTLKNTNYEISDITADGIVIDHGTGQVLISAN